MKWGIVMVLGKNKKKKQRVLKLNLDRTFEETKIERDGGKLKDGNNTINFEPSAVFDEKKKRHWWQSKRKLVLYVENTTKALKFKDVPNTEGKAKLAMDDFNPFWTMKEAKEFVERQVAEAIKERKPMTMWQFIAFIALLVIILGVVVVGFSNMGAL